MIECIYLWIDLFPDVAGPRCEASHLTVHIDVGVLKDRVIACSILGFRDLSSARAEQTAPAGQDMGEQTAPAGQDMESFTECVRTCPDFDGYRAGLAF